MKYILRLTFLPIYWLISRGIMFIIIYPIAISIYIIWNLKLPPIEKAAMLDDLYLVVDANYEIHREGIHQHFKYRLTGYRSIKDFLSNKKTDWYKVTYKEHFFN